MNLNQPLAIQHYTNLVIDLDFSVVKNNPFQNKKTESERELPSQCLNVKNAKNFERQKDDLKQGISHIILYASVMLNFIYQGMFNFKDLKNAMKKDKNFYCYGHLTIISRSIFLIDLQEKQ